MSITITISGETPEILAAHAAWVANKIGSIDVIKEVKAKQVADKALEKAAAPAPVVEPVDAPAAPVPAADKADVQKLAQVKSKTSGAEAVKDCIAKFGGKNINSTPAEKLAELKTALEALA